MGNHLEDNLSLDFSPEGMDDLDFSLESVGDFQITDDDAQDETRYLKPRITPARNRYHLFDTAQSLAEAVVPDFGERYDAFVSGAIVFGDFVEQLFYRTDMTAKRLIISTLSLSGRTSSAWVNSYSAAT